MASETNNKIHTIALSSSDVVDLLKTAIEREGSQSAFAEYHRINRTYLNMVLSGKRPVGDSVAEALGLRKAYVVSPRLRADAKRKLLLKRRGLIDA